MKINWETKKLGEVVSITKGKNPKLFKLQTEEMLPYLGAKFMRGTKDAEFALISDNKSVPISKDDLIIICDGSKSGDMFSGFEGVLSSTMGKMEFDKDIIIPGFLKAFLDLNFEFFNESIKGAAIPHLDFKVFKNLEIPLPPLETQKEIVAELYEKFLRLREAKKLREESIADTKKILSQNLREIFEEGKQKGWKEKDLHETCEIARGGSPRPIQHYLTDSDEGINWIKISDATSSDKYIYKTKQKITKEGLHKTRMVYPGDFILTNSMSFGRPYIMKTEGAIHDGWLLLRPNKDISEEYLYYFLSSDDIYIGNLKNWLVELWYKILTAH